MTQQQAGHTIADIYKSVINDVISQVKEAFLDENVDVDVLQQLKKEWEEKLIASGSVDMDGSKQMAPPPMRQIKTTHILGTSSTIPPGSTVRIAQNGQHILVQQTSQIGQQQSTLMQQAGAQGMQRPIQQVQYISANSLPIATDGNALPQIVQRQQLGQGQSQAISAMPSGMITFQPGQGARIIQQGGQQFFMHTGGPSNLPPGSSVMILNANGQQIPVTLGSASMLQQTRVPSNQMTSKMENSVHQLDGAGWISPVEENADTSEPSLAGSSKTAFFKVGMRKTKPKKTKAEKINHIPQLDGGGRISDSSSDDDDDDVDEDEDEDPLRRIVDRIGGDGNNIGDDEEQVAEEEPLNSEDDQSDDEDLETLFEADNVVMCQFEKVHRARSKWKFTLKDGIMHIQGKDYCFQRCSGEAEW